jgi:hypothetical protein
VFNWLSDRSSVLLQVRMRCWQISLSPVFTQEARPSINIAVCGATFICLHKWRAFVYFTVL